MMTDRTKLTQELLEAYRKELEEYTDAELVNHHQTLITIKNMPNDEFLNWLDQQELS